MLKPPTCLDEKCTGGEHCIACINRSNIAREGYILLGAIEEIPASIAQTKALNATERFIELAEEAVAKATPSMEDPQNFQCSNMDCPYNPATGRTVDYTVVLKGLKRYRIEILPDDDIDETPNGQWVEYKDIEASLQSAPAKKLTKSPPRGNINEG